MLRSPLRALSCACQFRHPSKNWLHSTSGSVADYAAESSLPPQPSKTRLIYPLLLFTFLTTITINQRSKRLESEASHQRLKAQISLLEELLADGRLRFQPDTLGLESRREIDRRLMLVGLKPHLDRPDHHSIIKPTHEKITWRQVFFGPSTTINDSAQNSSS
ncbi:hypothetical protein O181_062076 [Austropuccinia psidii MF-1]|uniref:Uncharacterized protein n=1 Tax=Austropuccinia psidii MF-1 TaxID=1389203 RepID=A0A9Q3EHC3_9BASI|nr:hypothetical protein [Austropuccinia psidii MF-1]